MKQPTMIEKMQYAFDNFMAKGTIALIGGLGILSLLVISIVALVVSIFQIAPNEGEPVSFMEAAWLGLMRTLDAGTMGGDTGWAFRIAMFVVTLGGVFIISTLIGILTSAVEGKMEEMRKGRSKVLESGHTVILGWSPQVFSIISELVIANSNQNHSCIVIMGDKDKVEMEEEIRDYVGDTGKTRIVCRTGNPIDVSDLKIVSLQTSKSIIVLSQEKDNPDAEVIKTILAITNNPDRRPEAYHIVAEIRDSKNYDVTKMVGQDEIEIVMVGYLISRIIAQTCRQSGLSIVYNELLDYGGDEIYFKEEPALIGKTFKDSLLAYEDSTVMGIWRPGSAPQLNPPMDFEITSGDQIIAISEDDDTIKLSGKNDYLINEKVILETARISHAREKTLVLGWNWRGETIVTELDQYVPEGSEVLVVSKYAEVEEKITSISGQMKNAKVSFYAGDTDERQVLNALNIEQYDHIILLCYSDDLEAQEADAQTLITLLHLRDIARIANKDFSIVSEMMDIRNRTLAEITEADDFIVSNRIVSLMLAQVSENKRLNAVFEDIFDPEGSEIYLKPAENYVKCAEQLNFYTVVEAARRRGEVAIGYRKKSESKQADKAYGVVVNPDKSDLISFEPGDKIILVAED
ncbi:MAG: NAD-binding protein [Anaerolineae bacterium]|nr:NAD-binding protein [Anaerolineae bacterium]